MADKQRAEQGHLCRTGASHRSGEHLTSWFAHAMRCSCGTSNSSCIFGLNCCLAGRSDACGVCVCVWNYRRFASLDLTAFWRGGPMH